MKTTKASAPKTNSIKAKESPMKKDLRTMVIPNSERSQKVGALYYVFVEGTVYQAEGIRADEVADFLEDLGLITTDGEGYNRTYKWTRGRINPIAFDRLLQIEPERRQAYADALGLDQKR